MTVAKIVLLVATGNTEEIDIVARTNSVILVSK